MLLFLVLLILYIFWEGIYKGKYIKQKLKSRIYLPKKYYQPILPIMII